MITLVQSQRNLYGHSGSYEGYILALSWPGSICALKNCNKSENMKLWNIHGLWPNEEKDSNQLAYC